MYHNTFQEISTFLSKKINKDKESRTVITNDLYKVVNEVRLRNCGKTPKGCRLRFDVKSVYLVTLISARTFPCPPHFRIDYTWKSGEVTAKPLADDLGN